MEDIPTSAKWHHDKSVAESLSRLKGKFMELSDDQMKRIATLVLSHNKNAYEVAKYAMDLEEENSKLKQQLAQVAQLAQGFAQVTGVSKK